MGLIVLLIILVALVGFLNFQFRLFYRPSRKLRILEYHSITTDGTEDQIRISKEKLIEQFEYLKKNNYTTLWLSDVTDIQDNNMQLPPKSVVLTFDDGFSDTYFELLPLLKQYEFKAVCFLVLGRIGKTMDWPGKYVDPTTLLLDANQIREAGSHIEFGYHTFKHDNYTELSFEDIEADLQRCQRAIAEEQLKVFPALAYTYGRYFRKKDQKQKQFFELLQKYGIRYGLRIGNRINAFPFTHPYELQRIDIRGNEPMEIFKKRVFLGRKKLV